MRELEVETCPCPGCGQVENPAWMVDHPVTCYRRCTRCKSIYASPRLSRAERVKIIDSFFQFSPTTQRMSANRRAALRQEADFLQDQVTGGRLLDVGCGNGTLFEFFPGETWERYGIELSPSAAEYAGNTYLAKVQAGTLQSIEFPTAYFDLATLIDTIFYLDDPLQDLKIIRRILKPGGLLAIEMPGLSYFLFRSRGVVCYLIDRKWTRLSSQSTYLNWLSLEGLDALLMRSNLKRVGWCIAQSPTRIGAAEYFTNFHALMLRCFSSRWEPFLSWAPKVLFLAKTI
jgi:SAM-dependent methyltransferase